MLSLILSRIETICFEHVILPFPYRDKKEVNFTKVNIYRLLIFSIKLNSWLGLKYILL